MLERFTEDLGRVGIDALAPAAGERVLDVGCGPGSTTIDLAGRVGAGGEVVGLEISPAMVAAAERRAADAGVGNARFVVHDLEQAPLVEGFDIAYSRFGVMFFARPDAAFSNLVASLRPGGRFAAVVWASPLENPWMAITSLSAAGALGVELPPPSLDGPGPFSLSDPDSLVTLLQGAGLVDVGVERTLGRLELHTDSAAFEVASMLRIGPLGDAFTGADERGPGRRGRRGPRRRRAPTARSRAGSCPAVRWWPPVSAPTDRGRAGRPAGRRRSELPFGERRWHTGRPMSTHAASAISLVVLR